MFTSTATVPTTRAARYRDQLASHGAGLMRHGGRSNDDGHAAPILGTAVEGTALSISLIWGRCTITATTEALELVAEADTREDLAQIQAGISNRISKIGRRDNLTVEWTEPSGEATTLRSSTSTTKRHSGLVFAAIGLLVIAAVAIHVGLAATLLKHHWTWWALGALAAVLLLKFLIVGRLMGARHAMLARLHRGLGI